MAGMTNLYLKKETIEALLKGINAKKDKGISLTITINDESNEWGQNVSAYVEQSKEDRMVKKPRYYVGNGNVFWNNGTIVNAVKAEDNVPAAKKIEEEFPF